MLNSRFFRFLMGTLLILLIIYLSTKVTFIFRPLVVFFQTLFIPFLIAGVLFYLLRPIVMLLHTKKVPKGISILLIYLGLIGVVTGIILLIGPTLQLQFTNLMDNMPGLMRELQTVLIQFQDNEWVSRFQETENFSIESVIENVTGYLMTTVDFLSSNIARLIGSLINFMLVFIIVPFMLFYLLKDGEKAPNQVLRFFPEKQQVEGRRILKDMDEALGSYIQGQIIVSICVGILMYIAFLIIGIEYSLILALVAMFTNVIPFVGPWIGTIPAVIVALIHSPIMVLWVLIAIVVVQQIESNLIAPQVMGKKLSIHPLTIIILILVGGRFAGFFGLLLAVPFYAVSKVIVSHTYRLLKLRKDSQLAKEAKVE
ncbi:AI-2E family transporter [Evansella tamaricis]|uniref:AI-2E family transporter n=1 Tax=Evansella tamaricis TaxID=2069301 RepID=A0ABS6JCR9_9BACI|nr:AI-2E family transporter [Evansella tamaricis]MBU9711464.1 AI-2E family transporter [Evansella tamaricis]